MKPFIEAAGGMILPAICYAQRGGMVYREIVTTVRNMRKTIGEIVLRF